MVNASPGAYKKAVCDVSSPITPLESVHACALLTIRVYTVHRVYLFIRSG